MTWNHDGDGIPVIGHAYRAESLRPADCACNVGIGSGLAIRNRQQCAPAVDLKCCAAQIQRKCELTPRAGEIFLKLADVARHSLFGLLKSQVPGLRPHVPRIWTNSLLPRKPRVELKRHQPLV